MKNEFYCWLANKLPRGLAYWCAIRVMSHAACANPAQEVDTLTPAQCLKAWSK